MSQATTALDTLDQAIATRLGDATFGLKVIDRIEMPDSAALPRQQGHCGVWYELASTNNRGLDLRDRQQSFTRVRDRLRVYLWYRVKPGAQLESRRDALAKEETIRDALTAYAWETPIPARFTYTDTTAREYVGDFYRIVQEFYVDTARTVGGQ